MKAECPGYRPVTGSWRRWLHKPSIFRWLRKLESYLLGMPVTKQKSCPEEGYTLQMLAEISPGHSPLGKMVVLFLEGFRSACSNFLFCGEGLVGGGASLLVFVKLIRY